MQCKNRIRLAVAVGHVGLAEGCKSRFVDKGSWPIFSCNALDLWPLVCNLLFSSFISISVSSHVRIFDPP